MADIQIMLTGNVNETAINRLTSEVTERVGKGGRSILLAISTPGGGVYWGVTAYHFLRGLGIEVVTHNLGQVDSIGGVIFAAGDQRYTVAQGRFLIHSVYWNFVAGANLSEAQLTENLGQVQKERDNIATILAERSGTALDTVREDMRSSRIMDAQEAIAYGLAHEVKDDVFDPAQEIVNITS